MKRLLRRLRGLKTACMVAAGLMTAWGNSATQAAFALPAPAPYTFTGGITPTQTLSDAVVIVHYFGDGMSTLSFNVYDVGDCPAGVETSFTFDVTETTDFSYDRFYTIVGLYDAANDAVTVNMSDDMADSVIGEGVTWNDIYNPNNSMYPEPTVSDWLQTDQYNNLGSFSDSFIMDGYLGIPITTLGDMVDHSLVSFSTAAAGGTAWVQEAVPEPVTVLLVSAGMAGVLTRRKRN